MQIKKWVTSQYFTAVSFSKPKAQDRFFTCLVLFIYKHQVGRAVFFQQTP